MATSVDGVRVKDRDPLLMSGLRQRAGSPEAPMVISKTNCAHRAKPAPGAEVGKSRSRADSAQFVKEGGLEALFVSRVVL